MAKQHQLKFDFIYIGSNYTLQIRFTVGLVFMNHLWTDFLYL